MTLWCDCCKVRLAEYRYTRMEVCVYCQQHLSPKELGPKNWQFEITQFASDGLINLEQREIPYYTMCECCDIYYPNDSPQLITLRYECGEQTTYGTHCAIHHRHCPDGHAMTQESGRALFRKLRQLRQGQ